MTAAFCAAVFMLWLLVTAAAAHAQLVGSDPADGAVVETAPRSIALTFSESVRPLVARLIHPDGRTEVLPDPGGRGSVVALSLPSQLGQGTHVLSWRVASSDGHPIGGGLVFSVGAPSATTASVEEQSPLSVRIGLWATRLVLVLALVASVGSGAFHVLFTRDGRIHGRRLSAAAFPAGLLAAGLLVGFQGLDVLGEPLSGLATLEVWKAGMWSTSYGRAVAVAAVALCVAHAAGQLGYRSRAGAALALAALILSGLGFAAAGHASTASPRFVTTPSVFLHATAALLWIGALVPLGLALARRAQDGAAALHRFSRAIPVIVGVLVVSGLVLSAVQLRAPAALWSTDYGLVLLAKLALVGAMFALAAWNRYRLTVPAEAGDARATRKLTRAIGAEVVLASVVIAVLGLWRFTPPPRAMAADSAITEIQSVVAENEGLRARLSIQPPVVGPVRVAISEFTLDGAPFEPKDVTIELGKPSYGVGPFSREAQRSDDGSRVADGFLLPLDGFWIVRATVLISDFRSVTLTEVFDVRQAAR
jgi:copper transport protein